MFLNLFFPKIGVLTWYETIITHKYQNTISYVFFGFSIWLFFMMYDMVKLIESSTKNRFMYKLGFKFNSSLKVMAVSNVETDTNRERPKIKKGAVIARKTMYNFPVIQVTGCSLSNLCSILVLMNNNPNNLFDFLHET